MPRPTATPADLSAPAAAPLPLDDLGVPTMPALTDDETAAVRASIPSPLDVLAAVSNLQRDALTPGGDGTLTPRGVAEAAEVAACVFDALPIPEGWSVPAHGPAVAALAVAYTAAERAEHARYEAVSLLDALVEPLLHELAAALPDAHAQAVRRAQVEQACLLLDKALTRTGHALDVVLLTVQRASP